MPTPRTQTKKEAILQAASKFFSERGYWDTSVSDISKATGVAEGTIFYHFQTKEDLFLAVLKRFKEDFVGNIKQHLQENEFTNGMAMVELPGRFQIVPGQPTLVLDVAHNPHSVAALTANLDAMGFFPTTHAVFGAMADKDLAPMLAKVGPLVDRWYFTDLPTPRAESAAVLQQKWNAVHMVAGGRRDVTSSLHADPLQALQAAVAAADPADRIVVFGSFYTVGGVLKNGVPRLHAKHLDA